MKNIIGAATLAFLTLIAPANAMAHSFTVALVIDGANPYSAQIKADFVRAAQERDGHADETADGHLGGLDVYILYATNAGELAALLSQQAIDISVLFDTAELNNGVQKLTVENNAVFIHAEAKDQENQGYITAQRIDMAIRSLGEVNDKVALANALTPRN
ncbi:MAG: hypothetical protein HRU29_04585 [Rhizobiales bacterium]|nr:hypothetical protein [Hyphomicrobiales bacterium]NRB13660.1 hypothetical protein [Hyphomicrobiales bacterium]